MSWLVLILLKSGLVKFLRGQGLTTPTTLRAQRPRDDNDISKFALKTRSNKFGAGHQNGLQWDVRSKVLRPEGDQASMFIHVVVQVEVGRIKRQALAQGQDCQTQRLKFDIKRMSLLNPGNHKQTPTRKRLKNRLRVHRAPHSPSIGPISPALIILSALLPGSCRRHRLPLRHLPWLTTVCQTPTPPFQPTIIFCIASAHPH